MVAYSLTYGASRVPSSGLKPDRTLNYIEILLMFSVEFLLT